MKFTEIIQKIKSGYDKTLAFIKDWYQKISAYVKKAIDVSLPVVKKIIKAIVTFFKNVVRFYREKKIPVLLTALAVLIVVLAFTLLMGGGVEEKVVETKYQQWMRQLRTKDIVECRVDSINEFFEDYYTALSEGDTTALESMYDDPLSANITTELSSIVSSYANITVYVTPGINDNEVVAFVYNDIYFVNIDQATPAVDSFYLKMDTESNSVYIMTAMYTDADINTFMYLASYREPIRSLLSNTESQLNAILESNDDLRNIYIIMSAMTEENAGDDAEDETESVSQTETGSDTAEETQTEGESQ